MDSFNMGYMQQAHSRAGRLLRTTVVAAALAVLAYGSSAQAQRAETQAARAQAPASLTTLRSRIAKARTPEEVSAQLPQLRETLIAADARERDAFDAVGRHIAGKKLPARIAQRHRLAQQAYARNSEATLAELDGLAAKGAPTRPLLDKLLQRLGDRPVLPATPAGLRELPAQPRAKSPRAPRRTQQQYRAAAEPLLVADGGSAGLLLAAAVVGLPTTEHLAQTEDAPFTDAIRAQATALRGEPVAIVNWVRNHIEYVPGYGSVQGADQTLHNRRGNAADTAHLLTAMLRASGIPTRYISGTVELDAAAARNWLGDLSSPQAALLLLQQAGVPAEAVSSAGVVTAIRFEHVWVEAYVDYEPSRGARNREPDTWVPVDASVKQLLHTPGIDFLRDLRFDAESFLQRLAAGSNRDTQTGAVSGIDVASIRQQLQAYQQQVGRFVDSVDPDARVADVLGTATLVERHPEVLAAVLPYRVSAAGAPQLALPDNQRWKLRSRVYASTEDRIAGRTVADLQRSLPQLGGKRLGLSFIPATQDDAETLASYLPAPHADGSPVQPGEFPQELPGYLIEMKAQLLAGDSVMSSGGSLVLGMPVLLQTELFDPGQQAWISMAERVVEVGEIHAMGINGQGTGLPRVQAMAQRLEALRGQLNARQYGEMSREELSGALLEEATLAYFAVADVNDQLYARIARAVSARQPSLLRAYADAQTTFAYGIPTQVRFPGVALQLDRLADAVVTRELDGAGQPVGYAAFRRAGLERASAYAHLVLERLYSGGAPQGASAVKALAQAVLTGTPIHRLTPANLDTTLARIDLPAAEEDLLRVSVHAGREGLVSESPVTIGNWSGSGLVIADQASGAGDYRISGGDSGRLQAGNFAWLALGNPAQAAGGALPTLAAAGRVHEGLAVLLGDSAGIRWRDYAAQPDVVGALLLGFVSGAAGSDAAHQAILLATADATTSASGTQASANHAPVFTTQPLTQAVDGKAYRYAASAADAEGDPISYRIVRAPGGVRVSASGLVAWDQPVRGDWLIVLRADDGKAYREQTWSLQVEPLAQPLSASLSVAPATADPGASVTITASASGGRDNLTRALTLNGQPIALPPDGVLQQAAPATPGSYRLALSVSDGSETLTREALLTVRGADDNSPPQVSITSPESDAEITGRVQVRGSASDDHFAWYKLMWRPVGAPDSAWREIATGTTAVADGILGTFDPTTLDNGLYQLGLFAADTGGRTASRVVGIEVYGEQKLGQFSVSFLDLEIEASGIPIRVTRSYDTRRKTEDLDFGYGWSVDAQSIRLRSNMILGLQWELQRATGDLSLCLRSIGKRRIAITLPDGKVERFNARNAQECKLGGPPPVQIVYDALPGTTSSLEVLNPPPVEARSGQLYDIDAAGAWDPQEYLLKTQDGTEYFLRQGVGIERIRDLWGNTLDYTASGLIHSAGQSIAFERDAQGRITQVTDPSGKSIRYSYDARGDLKTVTDREGRVAHFSYDRSHGLVDYTDPRGIVIARQIYDEQGRLIATIDANGQRTEVSYQPDDNRQVVKNRRGFETSYLYDGQGNILETVDALGHKTRYEYDANSNETRVTDALGHSTRREYNSANKLLTETDALGRTVTHQWRQDFFKLWYHESQTDARGNITRYTGNETYPRTIEEPEGRTTEIGYASKGNLGSLSIAGNSTGYGYNAKGQLTSETDPLGRITTIELDANGRETARSSQRTRADGSVSTVRSSRKLDAEGRVLEETGPTGLKTLTTYNAAGKVETETDARGKLTRHEYDSAARLTKTLHPDGGSEATEYDAEGNETAKTDRAGRVTRMEYDALNRLTKTIHPDGSTDETVYDEVGRVKQAKDSQGRGSVNEYDAAGRLKQATDTLGQVTAYQYDENGNRTHLTVAGQTTVFEYDALNRLKKTLLPDGTSTGVTWTLAGQKETETDASGKTSRYEYDAKGQLKAVFQSDGAQELATRYDYDEQGNKISQQDAEGRITHWEYNDLNQQTARILPEGQRESFEYDANGNLRQHKDFAGKVTRYSYDDLNREIERRYADKSLVTTRYTPTGQIDVRTGPNGSTRYQYDARDRLTRVESPEGVIRYQYDANGNRTVLSTKNQHVEYGYDELNRLKTVTDAKGKQTTYHYNARNQKERVSLPNGTSTFYEYDDNGRLKEIRHEKTADGTLLGAYRYELAANGQRMQLAERNQAGATRTVDYEYDGINRLTKETATDHRDNTRSYVTTWVYDKVGNRETQTKTKGGRTEVTTYGYDDNDRLLTEAKTLDGANQSSTAYEYDSNGNTTKKTVAAGSRTDVHGYGWNDDGRLVSYRLNGQEKAKYQYEPDGIRTAKNGTKYLVDHNQVYAQVVEENDDPSGTPEVVYLHGDDLLSQRKVDEENFYHADGLGSTRLLTDGAAALSDSYEFEAYGEVALLEESTKNDFRFTGEQYDPVLGMYYLRARWMNGDGRFLSRDGFLGLPYQPSSQHACMYANGDPVNRVDYGGHFSFVVGSLPNTATIIARVGKAGKEAVTITKKIACKIGQAGMVAARADGFEGHHPLQKAVYGTNNEGLVFLADEIHDTFHSVQNLLFKEAGLGHANQGLEHFNSLFRTRDVEVDRKNLAKALRATRNTAKIIDKVCGFKKPLTVLIFVDKKIRKYLREGQ